MKLPVLSSTDHNVFILQNALLKFQCLNVNSESLKLAAKNALAVLKKYSP